MIKQSSEGSLVAQFSAEGLVDLLLKLETIKPDMEKQASGLAVDYAEAYYKARILVA